MFIIVYWVFSSITLAQVAAQEVDQCFQDLATQLFFIKNLSPEKETEFENLLDDINKEEPDHNGETEVSMFRNAPGGVSVPEDMQLKCWSKDGDKHSEERQVICKTACSTIIVCMEIRGKVNLKTWDCRYLKRCDMGYFYCDIYKRAMKETLVNQQLDLEISIYKCDVRNCGKELCNTHKWNNQQEMAKYFNLDWTCNTNLEENLKNIKNLTIQEEEEKDLYDEDETDYDELSSLASKNKTKYSIFLLPIIYFILLDAVN